ncbi:pR37 [rat cytomegalovirus strain Maastricht]|uniref:PR37 n=1 Tax=Rat cytomegalovirus (strain Maastricht) TaxID=79700 RepID=Q9DWF4_RCMVM|nr:pR37 [rat cytomegalovirus strain Maastricht]AAF99135.1 pR37 [rat cytomegalovirus strain Maastricht]WEG71961.1 envelope glycoprotein UL37 [Murid betaherpesvirus 2]
MSRRSLLCLAALQLAFPAGAGAEGRELRCAYDMCVTRRREPRVLVGCLVTCRVDRELVFSGTCSDWFGVVSWWFVKNVRHSSHRELRAVKIGLAYYFSGYLLRPLSSRVAGSLKWTEGNASHLGGAATCWRRDGTTGGSVELNVTETERYVLDVRDGERNATWKGSGNRSEVVGRILGTNVSLDVGVLLRCGDIVDAAVVGHASSNRRSRNLRTSVVRKEPCVGANVYLNWSAVWANWTKYGEFDEFCYRDVAFHLSVRGREGGDRLANMTGMFIVATGAFALLALLCCMSMKQRRSILKDFQGRSSLRSTRGEPEGATAGSLASLRRVSL